MKRVFVGITGASGVVYGVTLVRALAGAGLQVPVCISPSGRKVLRLEMGVEADPEEADAPEWLRGSGEGVSVFPHEAVEAPFSSGSYRTDAAVICPCSLGTLAAVAHGLSGNLIERVAEVMLKEGRPLILVPRETPLSLVSLRNMTLLAEAGAVVLPACPGFYHEPRTVLDLVRHVVSKITDRLGLGIDLVPRWGGGG